MVTYMPNTHAMITSRLNRVVVRELRNKVWSTTFAQLISGVQTRVDTAVVVTW